MAGDSTGQKQAALRKGQDGAEPARYETTACHLATVSPWIFQTELMAEKCETALAVPCITTPARKVRMLNVGEKLVIKVKLVQ